MSDLQALLDNKIDSIIVDDIISAAQIRTFMQALQAQPEWQRTAVDSVEERLFVDTPRPQYLFLSQYALAYLQYDERAYMEKCKEYEAIWADMTAQCGFDIFAIFSAFLKKQFQVELKKSFCQ